MNHLEESPSSAGLKYYHLDGQDIYHGEKSKKEVAEMLFSIIRDKEFRDLLVISEYELDELRRSMSLKSEELIKILRELEAYELLPGKCKYLRGCNEICR